MRVLLTVCTTISICIALPAHPQIALDGTTGHSDTLSGPNYKITERMGAVRGNNLFHSFKTFSIQQGESATFKGPDGLAHVISRVTGGEVSTIDGQLTSEIPNADFWFINPAGVVFGPHAEVHVPAAFHVSTADELRFADGGRFAASDPQASTLTSARPEAFGFLGKRALGAIVVKDTSLNPSASDERKNVSLVADDIIVDGGEIFARSGVVRLIAARAGEVMLTATGAGMATVEAYGDTTLKDARIETAGSGGGRVFIRSGMLEMTNTTVETSNWGNRSRQYEHSIDIGLNGPLTMSEQAKLESLADPGDGGGVRITATDVILSGASRIVTNTQSTGAAGGIDITADDLTVEDNSTVSAFTKGSGPAGSITISAGDQVSVIDSAIVTKPSLASATGRGGDIRMDAGEIRLVGHSSIVSGFDGEERAQAGTTVGPAGIILLKASRKPRPNGILTAGKIVVGKGAEVSAQAYAEQGGGIAFRAEELTFEEATVSVSTYGRAGGSEINFDADTIRLLAGTDVAARSDDSGSGGTIRITAADTFTMSGGNVDASPFWSGDGGAVTIGARILDVREQSNISTGVDRAWRSSLTRASGDAGNIRLEATAALTIHDSVVGADVFEGQGGIITLVAPDVRIDNSGVVASVWGAGKGGNIRIDAERLEVANEGQGIFALTDDAGSGGSITINVSDSLAVADTNISVQTTNAGSAGDIHIQAGSIIMTEGGIVSAEAFVPEDDNDPASPARLGPPGLISIDVDDTFVIDGSQVITTTQNAAGPPMTITTAKLNVVNGGLIDASTSGPMKGGDISINAGTLVVDGGGLWPASEDATQRSSIVTKAFRSGPGGTITIDATDITLSAGGEIATSSFDDLGNAGTITLQNARRLILDGSSITTEALKADGGQIDIRVGELIRMKGSEITTRVAGGVGNAGDIFIDPTFLVMENSRIEAKALGGQGGNIDIIADFIIRGPANIIDATSAAGPRLSGTVTLSGPEADLAGTIAVPPPDFLDVSSLLAKTCPGRSGQPRSGLVQGGRGGLPADPSRLLHASVIADKPPETSMRSSEEPRSEGGALAWPVPVVDSAASACIEKEPLDH